ncbi:MAG TPA: hypothetical protein VFC55_05225, partial [Desulfobaccales bacterium]|nr:hypothetical protein [Desulfobaccales bacterium]
MLSPGDVHHNHYAARQPSQGNEAIFPIIIALIGDGDVISGQDLPGIVERKTMLLEICPAFFLIPFHR